ncbi:hypothetical protein DMN91_001132 [Ooceraea biroi]|uniref:Uncharacterized protein n=1 Tax=Ooceraea biroi TaxID=2015173 RepID=A0A3L8E3Q6_OOCBI|nr:uncharacterized protein LOC105274880 [Ooceraea biroi]RLU27331.1 hypothetical protein DMN91_001132 [Ooceraea biroi]
MKLQESRRTKQFIGDRSVIRKIHNVKDEWYKIKCTRQVENDCNHTTSFHNRFFRFFYVQRHIYDSSVINFCGMDEREEEIAEDFTRASLALGNSDKWLQDRKP